MATFKEFLLNENMPGEPKVVYIRYNPEYDEYRVPAPDGSEEGAYYTDDKEDAVGTAKNFMYKGQDIMIKFTRAK